MSAESLPADRLIGSVLASRYQIEFRLGEGAMGAVYKARHVKVGRPFAVKVLHARLLEDKKVALRFEREAELAGRLRHPNVVGVVDVGEVDGMRYMVMDFAEGPDLASLLSEAPMPPARIVNLVKQLLEGLYHAHEQGLIHRDFKPENIIIERDQHGNEVPRIVDFGIAILRDGGDSTTAEGRITTNGLVLGTPHYMAPEQAVADPIDHRIDLFALGIVIYELLCGRLPFDGSGAEIARANLLLDPPPIIQRVPYLEVDPLLEAFARKLMSKKRELRPPTAKAARELLDLIERDPKAAAAVLGVPLEASTRLPATTLPVAPVVAKRPGSERGVSTAMASPLDFEGAKRSKAPWIIGGAIGIAAIGVATVIALGTGGSEAPPPAHDPIVLAPTPPPAQPPPTPPVVEEKPAPPPPPQPVVEPPVAKPPPAKPPVTHKATPKKITKPPVAEVKPPPEPPKPPPEVKHEPSTDGISGTALATLYAQVGSEVLSLPSGVGGDLKQRYLVLKRDAALLGTQADRDAMARTLVELRRGAAQLRQK